MTRFACSLSIPFVVFIGTITLAGETPPIEVTEKKDESIQITTDKPSARIKIKGYVSGIAQGSLVDKETGAKDLGFGLHIMDFLLAPGWADDEYVRDAKLHGNLPKHYVEGPQICTKAKQLKSEIIKGNDFVAVRLSFRFTEAAPGLNKGSLWEQTLVFQPGVRYVISGEQITSANDLENVFYRIDMPGHVRHQKGDNFSQVYLSYKDKISADEFKDDFAPDAKFLYQRDEKKIPERMIRAYQIKGKDKPGPWLAGMTLDPAAVSEAWCHQRGYICFIQELHGRKVKKGESFGAAYVIGYFDDISAMEKVYDKYKGKKRLKVTDKAFELE
jgi:hypothetical protein